LPVDLSTRAARFLPAILIAVAAVTVPDVGGAGDGPAGLRARAQHLRSQTTALASRSHSALLELYGIESQLSRAQSRLASLEAQAAAVRAERALVRRRLGIARRIVAAAQQGLADRVRTLYETGDPDPLAVVLGAESIDDAMAGLDALDRVADQDRRIGERAARARAQFQRSARALAAREARLGRLESQARTTAAVLSRVHDEHAAEIARLSRQERLNRAQIGALESQARAAEERSRRLQATQPAADAAPSPSPAVHPAAAVPLAGDRQLTVIATAYSLPGRTASGLPTGPGVVAVDPTVIPLGTRMSIPGYGEGVAADTGLAIKGARIDLWFPTLDQARAWGARTVTITIHG
jgi:3D (Asp-Asp-Asp) domain-containing protein